MPPPTTLLGGILDGSATNQLVTVASAFITGDGLVIEKNELCVDHEEYRHAAASIGVSGGNGGSSPQNSMQGSDLGGMERDAAAASRVNDALLTTQQARSAGVMMRTALRMHNPQVFIDHESKRVASEDSCPMDRGVGVQVPFTQMNVVVLPSNENGFCLTGSDDLPYLLSILSDTHSSSSDQPTGSPSSRGPSAGAGGSSSGCGGVPQITIHTSTRTIQCDALLLDAVSSSSAPGGNDDTGSPTQLGFLTTVQQLNAAVSQSSINGGCGGGTVDDNDGTMFAGEGGGAGGGGDGTLSGMDVTSNNYGEELVRALHRNQKHALAFVVTAAEN